MGISNFRPAWNSRCGEIHAWLNGKKFPEQLHSEYNCDMTNQPEKPPEEKKTNYMIMGIAVGLAIGAGIGLAMNNIAIGLGVGVAIGVAIGAGMEEQQKRKPK